MALLWQIFFLHLIDIDFRIKQTTSGFGETDISLEKRGKMWCDGVGLLCRERKVNVGPPDPAQTVQSDDDQWLPPVPH